MVNDPIADMLISIKNAGSASLLLTRVPYSKLKFEIVNVLLKEGLIKSFSVKGKKVRKHLEVEIAYKESESLKKLPRISDVRRISKPSRRVYLGARDIKSERQGGGILVVSTPQGVLTGTEARNNNVGGEAMFSIW